jgi:hypothetical protein
MHLALLISAALSTKTWHTPSIPHTTRENMEFSKRGRTQPEENKTQTQWNYNQFIGRKHLERGETSILPSKFLMNASLLLGASNFTLKAT